MGALRPGQRLEGTSYEVVRELGSGGMGVVYEIEHVRLKKRYVAKVIHDQIKNEESAAKRMEREAQVLATISHPNVVQVHDVGVTPDGTSYFVMEKLEGVDLRNTIKQRGITRVRAIEILTDVLEALDYVHRRGIVHRDIKPENVFLAEQGNATVTKVLDFGIVHIFDSDGHLSQGRITKTGGFVGTLYYAAPEQMQGKPAGPPNDVYAAGLVLFELLAGKGPCDDDPGVGLSRCFKPAPLLSEFVPAAPADLTEALARALEQDPAKRPSAGDLAAELRKITAGLKATMTSADDDPVRAEVDDLLRHIAPDDRAPPRPAAGRPPSVDPDVALEATAVPPPTPVMPGAPTHGTAPAVSPPVGPTVVSATPAPPSFAHSPTLPDAGAPPQRISTPSVPPLTTNPYSPDTSTSPGLYATIDHRPVAFTRAPARPSWVAFAAGGAALLLVGVVAIGAIAHRQRTTPAAAVLPASSTTPPVMTTPSEPASPPEPTATSATVATAAPAASTSTAPAAAASITPPRPPARPVNRAAPTTTKPASSKSATPMVDMDGHVY